MKGAKVIVAGLCVAVILGMPVLGVALTPPRSAVPAHELRFGEGLTIDFLAPLANRTDFYGGSVIPVKIALIDNDDTPVKNANVTIWVNGTPGTSPGAVGSGNQLRELRGGLYMFNLDTKPYPAGPGSAPITIKVVALTPEDHVAENFVTITLD